MTGAYPPENRGTVKTAENESISARARFSFQQTAGLNLFALFPSGFRPAQLLVLRTYSGYAWWRGSKSRRPPSSVRRVRAAVLCTPRWRLLHAPLQGAGLAASTPVSDSGFGTRQAKSGKFSFWVAEVDQPPDDKVLQDNELEIPPEIETEIREARHRFHHGEVDDLSGHSMLTMLKVAAGFMWLDGRTDKITESDCELARIGMAISDRTRA